MRVSKFIGSLFLSALWIPAASAQPCAPAGDSILRLPRPCYADPPDHPPFRLGIEAFLGVNDQDAALDPIVLGFGVDAELGIGSFMEPSSFHLGASARYQSIGDGFESGDGSRYFDAADETNAESLELVFGPRFYLATEPARREGFRLGLGGGVRVPLTDVGQVGPIVELKVERQGGTLNSSSENGVLPVSGFGRNVTLGVRAQIGLPPIEDYRAILLTVSYASEFGVPLPEGRRQGRQRPAVEYILAVEGGTVVSFVDGYSLGAGGALSLGVSLAQLLPFLPTSFGELRARAGFFRISGVDREPDNILTFTGQLRVPRWFPFAVEAGLGYSTSLGSDQAGILAGPVAEFGFVGRMRNVFGCGVGIAIPFRGEIGLGDAPTTLTFSLAVEYDSLIRASECTP